MLSPRTKLGPYEILAPLGAGGMGEVYRAQDSRLGREVAIKVLPEEVAGNADRLARFDHEIRAVAAISHPNILALYDVGREGSLTFAVTELLEGETLRAALGSGAMPWRRVSEIAKSVAEGLAAAHAKGIVHRDIKPENIFLTSDGRVKILDFGLARILEGAPAAAGDETPTLPADTAPGTVMGTVGYMSPEQVRGVPAGPRSDIFALGCVAFEAVTGRRAFSGGSSAEALYAILHQEPPEGLEAVAETASGFVQIIVRCLKKNPEDRFQTMPDLAFALGLVMGEALPRRSEQRRPAGAAAPPATLAVLPFVNRSPDPDNEYFSDGMTEELIGALSRVPGLRVASRSSVFALKGRAQDARELGAALGAAVILEGSVRRAADRVRITAQLTEVANGFHLWSETYDRDIRDMFAVQDEIAQTLVETLRKRLGLPGAGAPPRRPETPNLHAYHQYLRGRYFWAKRTPENRVRAIAHFEEAILADPGYARAHAGLADCYLERGGGLGGTAFEVMTRSRRAALRALEINESLPDAHTSLARVLLYYDWDWSAAESEFKRSLELDPGYAEGHHSYSHFLLPAGRVAESLDASRRALELEPLDLGINTHLGWHFLYSGDMPRAAEQCRLAIDLDTTFFYAHFYLGMVYEQEGELERALPEFDEAVRLSRQSSEAAAGRARLLARLGKRREAEAVVADIATRRESSVNYEVGVVLDGLGETDRALDAFEAGFADRAERMVDMWIDPRLHDLHSNRRFRDIARRVGLPTAA
jgi:serine/threonine-protein kinase